MLTSRDTLEDKLEGFARGADDYLVKPFALRRSEARLVALHKRHAGRVTSSTSLQASLSFNPETLAIRFADRDVKLPPQVRAAARDDDHAAQPRFQPQRARERGLGRRAGDERHAPQPHARAAAGVDAGGRLRPIENVHGHGLPPGAQNSPAS
jgi:hypothetical protein